MEPVTIHQIETEQDFKDAQEYINSNESFDFILDTETDNKIEKLAHLYGIGFCVDSHEAFYIPIRKKDTSSWWSEKLEQEIAEWLFSLAQKKRLVGHNILYDVLVLNYNWNLDFTPYIYSDTILQKHCLDEERPHGLKETAIKYLGPESDKAQQALYENIQANGGKTLKDNVEMYKADTAVLGEYCGWDCILTKRLFDLFEPRIHKEGLANLFYKDEIMPLYKEVTIPMKQRGFPIDAEYFKDLNFTITQEIENLEKKTYYEINPLIQPYVEKMLEEEYPIKKTGNFPKHYATVIGYALPVNKDGKITLARKEIDKLPEPIDFVHKDFLNWLKGAPAELHKESVAHTRQAWWNIDHESPNVFNLNSTYDLKHLFFNILGESPLSYTDKAEEPQVDDDFLESVKGNYQWVQSLIDYKKLTKLKSTYIEGILERQLDGVIHTSLIQFGPPSGRYASKNPNLQNLPRIKDEESGLSELVLKYVNSIKKGFVAGEGNLLVNADYSQLEPRAFAEACGDTLLQQVFKDKEDLYGAIAKRIWNLPCSANEVKKQYPEYRQKAKTIALAVVYGAEAGRVSKLMGNSYQESQEIIDDYLNSYPGLKNYMESCNREVCLTGAVKTKFGRVRHLPNAKWLYKAHGIKLLDKKWAKQQGLSDTQWKFKNMLNLAKNFPIQGVAAHVVNRAAIAMNREFKKRSLSAIMVMQVHDELTTIAKKEEAEEVKEIVKRCMETTTKLSVPLIAEPIIAYSWDEAK